MSTKIYTVFILIFIIIGININISDKKSKIEKEKLIEENNSYNKELKFDFKIQNESIENSSDEKSIKYSNNIQHNEIQVRNISENEFQKLLEKEKFQISTDKNNFGTENSNLQNLDENNLEQKINANINFQIE